ncbi:cytochrome P450 [Streptomyces sp. NBC_01017]|uniref:cytochrome P450 n=1 Tax=Streptomyces sp. NBC_01017 TaxID=2903721 RepID=UPI00386B283A|nr:cytochrome P450 [Streptomyces sp. NBC_01017]WSV35094.1 cytochrome P450 [Streptomyces sp. NBC_01017]
MPESNRVCPHAKLFDPAGVHRNDPHPFLARARREQPVFYAPQFDRWCVTRYDDIVTILRDKQNFSARDHKPAPLNAELPPDVLETLATWRGDEESVATRWDGLDHTKMRAVAGAQFTQRALSPFESDIRGTAAALTARLVARGDIDFISEFAIPFTLNTILKILGIPDEFQDRCRRWSQHWHALKLNHPDLSDSAFARQAAQSLREFGSFARDMVAQRKSRPRDDVISHMLHNSQSERSLTATEVVALLPTIISAGHETSAQALALIVSDQLDSPGGWSELSGGHVPIAGMIEESLRLEAPLFGVFRTAKRPVTVGGIQLAEGSRLLLLCGSGNHDENRYENPTQRNVERKFDSPHLSFGLGSHFCVGAPLARLELTIAMEELAAGLPQLTLAPEASRSYHPIFPLRALTELRLLT